MRRRGLLDYVTLAFLHIPKTGGQSLRHTLLRAAGPRRSEWLDGPGDVQRLAALSVEVRRSLAYVDGHVYFGLHQVLPRPCLYATLLRHPVDRVASLYDYVRSSDWHHLYPAIHEQDLSLIDCLRRGLTVELDNFMTRTLAGHEYAGVPFGGVTGAMLDLARSHLESCALVGTTERLAESYSLLPAALGVRAGPPPHLNPSPLAHRHRPSPEAAHAILERNRYDLDLFERADELLSARLQASGLLHSKAAAVGAAAARISESSAYGQPAANAVWNAPKSARFSSPS